MLDEKKTKEEQVDKNDQEGKDIFILRSNCNAFSNFKEDSQL